ncbi:MAG: hypothetical protein M5U12_24665 [Verrucomicrobia bacterium]|nr:hypothetical protein [Verrucomicrobiota bacterium]
MKRSRGWAGVETWLPIERRPVQVGATEILHLPLSGVLGEGTLGFGG